MTEALRTAVQNASRKWQSAFNAGDGAGCAAMYEEDALMVAAPFGDFRGRDTIQAFWDSLIADGYTDVTYIDPVIKIVDDESAILSAKWKMNKAAGIIIKELWGLQEDGTALLREDHFAVDG